MTKSTSVEPKGLSAPTLHTKLITFPSLAQTGQSPTAKAFGDEPLDIYHP